MIQYSPFDRGYMPLTRSHEFSSQLSDGGEEVTQKLVLMHVTSNAYATIQSNKSTHALYLIVSFID